jgi:hypothetical protein
MLTMVYHHYEASSEVIPLYFLHLILLLLLRFYLVSIAKNHIFWIILELILNT